MHWSAVDVMELPIKRANKIRNKLDDEGQDTKIYLKGILGFVNRLD
jgi:hypothetical protein